MSKIVRLFGGGAARETGATSAERSAELAGFLERFSIEVMPRTAEKIERFGDILPTGTRIYIAHIDGTPIADMRRTAARLIGEGFEAMPHIPARVVPSAAALEDWVGGYGALGVEGALLIGGGLDRPRGPFADSMQMMETGLFERYGFRRLHVAGHPEGNKDIDPDGGEARILEAVLWKQAFAERTGLDMAIVTQFAFESAPVIAWAERLAAAGVRLPIHLGVAGPAKLQTLIKFAIACGVGPSLRVLQRRAADVTKLLLPFEPTEILAEIAAYKAAHPQSLLTQAHLFPLGGVGASATWAGDRLAAARTPRALRALRA